jgi:hypothetical protein
MSFAHAHPWLLFLFGCWVGAFVGCAITPLLAGARLRRLESSLKADQQRRQRHAVKLRLRTVLRLRNSA